MNTENNLAMITVIRMAFNPEEFDNALNSVVKEERRKSYDKGMINGYLLGVISTLLITALIMMDRIADGYGVLETIFLSSMMQLVFMVFYYFIKRFNLLDFM